VLCSKLLAQQRQLSMISNKGRISKMKWKVQIPLKSKGKKSGNISMEITTIRGIHKSSKNSRNRTINLKHNFKISCLQNENQQQLLISRHLHQQCPQYTPLIADLLNVVINYLSCKA